MRNLLEDGSRAAASIPAEWTYRAVSTEPCADAHLVILERTCIREVLADGVDDADSPSACNDSGTFDHAVCGTLSDDHVVVLSIIADPGDFPMDITEVSDRSFFCHVVCRGGIRSKSGKLEVQFEVFPGQSIIDAFEREVIAYRL